MSVVIFVQEEDGGTEASTSGGHILPKKVICRCLRDDVYPAHHLVPKIAPSLLRWHTTDLNSSWRIGRRQRTVQHLVERAEADADTAGHRMPVALLLSQWTRLLLWLLLLCHFKNLVPPRTVRVRPLKPLLFFVTCTRCWCWCWYWSCSFFDGRKRRLDTAVLFVALAAAAAAAAEG